MVVFELDRGDVAEGAVQPIVVKGSRINNCGSGYGEWSVGVMR
jgi:hypothetical protein